MTTKFNLGRVVATPAVLAAFERTQEIPLTFLSRHSTGDWGEIAAQDWKANDLSVANGLRILSAYRLKDGTKFWLITEHDRSVTTFLLPTEY